MSVALYIVGFPSLYGGAGAELYHQVRVWEALGVTLHFIPTQKNVRKAVLYGEMTERRHVIHDAYDWAAIPEDAPVISFCNEDFLAALPEIRKRTRRTVFVNCMTWLFGKEKEAMSRGDIALFLYQNDQVRQSVMPRLRALNGDPSIRFMTFRPYFDSSAFPYVADRPADWFGAGHISRQDEDKFSKDTWLIYEHFASPVPKRGTFLGFDARSEGKTGKPPDWVETFHDQKSLTQQEFYRRCHIVLQPTDTTENWPRIGFEAMASGSVLIVDKRGGWEQMIEHGRTGWLCESPGDFIACATKMAWEPHYREDMAAAARERGLALGGLEASLESWRQVFDVIEEL
ncbi:glycosyltransferase [Akkermansia sp.]|uniref:glycosyltransferase n=1 Tax=Akkermansia sp. TaxID=1872421 RepID=UPI00266C3E74|nr:glycosyltransferase [Akkermansia sp.]